MDPTEWKHQADGGGLEGREAGAFFLTASRFVLCVCQRLLLPRTTAPPQQSFSVAPVLSAQRRQCPRDLQFLTGFLNLSYICANSSLLNALELCHLSGMLSSAGTLTDSRVQEDNATLIKRLRRKRKRHNFFLNKRKKRK